MSTSPTQLHKTLLEIALGFKWYRLPQNKLTPDRQYKILLNPVIQDDPILQSRKLELADGTERECNWEYNIKEANIGAEIDDNFCDQIVRGMDNLTQCRYYHKLFNALDYTGQPEDELHFCTILEMLRATPEQKALAIAKAFGRYDL